MDEKRAAFFNPVLSPFAKAVVGREVYHSSPMSGFGIEQANEGDRAGDPPADSSVGSILSVGSAGSILSIGSAGSVLSIGSAGSVLSIGSAGSVLSLGSFASVASIGSTFSFGGVFGFRQTRPALVQAGATVLAVAALGAAVLHR